VILLDTSGLLAAIDRSQQHHQAAAASLRAAAAPRILSLFVLAELDYLLASRVGPAAQDRLLEQVAAGVYRLESFDGADVARVRSIIERYRDLGLGIADASIVVLAERHEAGDVLTLDKRHFRALRGPGGRPFRLLPADA
jgi:Predicted nucleic acid-binding protein, contains PIN domain